MSDDSKPKYDPLLGDLTGPDFSGMSEDEIVEYWKNTTTAQRFHEGERFRRLKWDGRLWNRWTKQ